jgi:hypothetical protein
MIPSSPTTSEPSIMTTLTAIDALPVVRARAEAATGNNFPGALALYCHATKAWDDEYDSYKALNDRGLHDAARCAFARRTAFSELASILVRAL